MLLNTKAMDMFMTTLSPQHIEIISFKILNV